jgi:hypothetical protein
VTNIPFRAAPKDLVQFIDPWTLWGNQMGFININTQASADPALEAQIVERVASYGRQLGRLSDAVGVVLKALRLDDGGFGPRLDSADREAVRAFIAMLREVDEVKAQAAPAAALAKEFQRLRLQLAQTQARDGRPQPVKRRANRARKGLGSVR